MHSNSRASLLRVVHRSKMKVVPVLLVFAALEGVFLLYSDQLDFWNDHVTDRIILPMAEGTTVPPERSSRVMLVDSNFYLNRSRHAEVIDRLAWLGASAIALDVIFDAQVGGVDDAALQHSVERFGRVYFGMAFGSLASGQDHVGYRPAVDRDDYLERTKWRIAGDGLMDAFPVGRAPMVTYPDLAKRSRGLGFVNVAPDRDGVVRRVPLLVGYKDGFFPSLPFRMVCDALGVGPADLRIEPGECIRITNIEPDRLGGVSEIEIPVDRHGKMLIYSPKIPSPPRPLTYSRIISASASPEETARLRSILSGKLVLMSETVEKLYPLRGSGPDTLLPEGAIHQAVIRTILNRSFLVEAPASLAAAIEAALAAVLVFAALRFPIVPFHLTAVGLLIGYPVAALVSFHSFHLLLPLVRSVVLLIGIYGTLVIVITIDRAVRFAEVERARRIAERDLTIGREIQSGFFPTRLPRVSGWDIEGYFRPARQVAGDFYDVFTLGRGDRIALVVADVCGKGVGAALFMALLRSIVRVLSGRAIAEDHLDTVRPSAAILSESVTAINHYLAVTHERTGMFATLFYGIIDTASGDLDYVNAGHEPPMILRPGEGRIRLMPSGAALGVAPEGGYRVRRARLDAGDALLIYTDGVSEACDHQGRMLTRDGFGDLLREPVPSAGRLIRCITERVDHHMGGADPSDDMTMLVCGRNGTAAPAAPDKGRETGGA